MNSNPGAQLRPSFLPVGRALWLALAVLVATLSTRAQITPVGGIARDFTVTDRFTGNPIHLRDFDGQVLVLDFFAYWCGPCRASSPDVEVNIKEYYEARNGNTHGVPVTLLSVNIESGSDYDTDAFIAEAGLDLVADDYTGSAYNQFTLDAIPLFVIINGVADSPSHEQWQVLYREAGYQGAAALRAVINRVEASDPTAPPRVWEAPQGRDLFVGEPLSLSSKTGGAKPRQFQWYLNSQPIPGATNTTYQQTAAQLADAGSYLVEVVNAYGTARSTAAKVQVVEPGPTNTVSYTGGAIAIPDGSDTGINSTISVTTAQVVYRLRVSVRIIHSYSGDLRVALRCPTGKEVVLKEVSNDPSDNFIISGKTLTDFNGRQAKGTWTLKVSDGFIEDTGRLESWSIQILTAAPSLTESFQLWMLGFPGLAGSDTAAGADPDGDSIPNLIEYLLADRTPDHAELRPTLHPDANLPDYFEYALQWRSGADTRSCRVWFTEDISVANWQEIANRGTDIIVDRADPSRLVIRVHRALPRFFLQLRAGLPVGN